VLAPLPQFTAAKPSERILTMTSCNPRFSAAERIIAYAVMDAFFPRAGGAPNEVFSPTTAEVG
jgi:sortase A